MADEMLTEAGSAVDAISGPTLLGYVKTALSSGQTTADIAHKISYGDMLLGFKAGSLGEIAALALLLGFIYLLYRKVITWHIPVSVIGSMAVFSGILWGIDPLHYMNPLFQVLTGGALLGAIFMATDYVTRPVTKKGQYIYGVILGFLTAIFRIFGASAEGVSYAIIFCNLLVPLIEKVTKPVAFGKGGKK